MGRGGGDCNFVNYKTFKLGWKSAYKPNIPDKPARNSATIHMYLRIHIFVLALLHGRLFLGLEINVLGSIGFYWNHDNNWYSIGGVSYVSEINAFPCWFLFLFWSSETVPIVPLGFGVVPNEIVIKPNFDPFAWVNIGRVTNRVFSFRSVQLHFSLKHKQINKYTTK